MSNLGKPNLDKPNPRKMSFRNMYMLSGELYGSKIWNVFAMPHGKCSINWCDEQGTVVMRYLRYDESRYVVLCTSHMDEYTTYHIEPIY